MTARIRGNDAYRIAGSCLVGREKSASHRVSLRRESRWSEIERGDIADKGDIVWDADDSQAGEETISACDTSCLKPSPTLFFSDLLLSLHLFLCASFNRSVTLLSFSRSCPSGLVWLALSSFSSSSCPSPGAFLFPSSLFCYKMQSCRAKTNVHLSSDLVSQCTSIYTH